MSKRTHLNQKQKKRRLTSTEVYINNMTKRKRRKQDTLVEVEDTLPSTVEKVEQTREKIAKFDNLALVKRKGGLELSKAAEKALAVGKIVATLVKNNPDRIMYNHKERIFHHGERLVKENNMSNLLRYSDAKHIKNEHYTSLLRRNASPSLLFLSFIVNKKMWIPKDNIQAEQDEHISDQNNDSNFLQFLTKNVYKTNRRCIDHDTAFPAVERKESNMSCVIVGCEKDICEVLCAEHDYAETCNTYMNWLCGKITTTTRATNVTRSKNPKAATSSSSERGTGRKSGHSTANNFPVLVGMEFQKVVQTKSGSKVFVDFCKQTSRRQNDKHRGLVPLLLTTCCEALHRVHLQYVQVLYDLGAVRLHPQPVDSSKILYRLSDFDATSLTMQLKKSTAVLYSVMIWCTSCNIQYNELWTPNVETVDPHWLKHHKCGRCNGHLTNDSCFVINGGQLKWRRDPACVQKIAYKYNTVKGQTELPEGVKGKQDMPQYEHVTQEVNAKHLKLHLRQDYDRKIQRDPYVSLTVFIPICFDKKVTEQRLEEKFGGKATFDDTHTVKAYCFVQGKEHEIDLILNRFKISLALNKKITIKKSLLPQRDHLLQCFLDEMHHLENTFENHEDDDTIKIGVPGCQSSKRIGVQTVDDQGEVCKHMANMVVRCSVRQGDKAAQDQRFREEANMYTAIHFWSAETDNQENNFTKYGPTLMAGLINNFVNHGKATVTKLSGEVTHVSILQRNQYAWLNLKEIISSMNEKIVDEIYNKEKRKLKAVNKEIEKLTAVIREKERVIVTMKCNENMMISKLAEANETIKEKTEQYEQLFALKETLERNLRAIKRSYTVLSTQHKELCQKVDRLEQREKQVEERIQETCEKKISEMFKQIQNEQRYQTNDRQNVIMEEENNNHVVMETEEINTDIHLEQEQTLSKNNMSEKPLECMFEKIQTDYCYEPMSFNDVVDSLDLECLDSYLASIQNKKSSNNLLNLADEVENQLPEELLNFVL